MAPCKILFTVKASIDEFFFTDEVVEMVGKSLEQKVLLFLVYLKLLEFLFYRQELTLDSALPKKT